MTAPLTLALAEAADRIGGVSVDWLARQLRSGRAPGVKLGRSWRMTEADIAAVIESNHRGAVHEPNPWGPTPTSLRRAQRRSPR